MTTLATGLRQANVTRLQWKQISLERRHLWVSGAEHKNGRPHSVPRNQAALDVLEKRNGDHQTHVFTYEGNPIVQVNTRAWRNALHCGRAFTTSAGMICGTRSPPGKGKREHRPTSCNVWAGGRHNPWLSGMLTLRRKVCSLPLVGWIRYCKPAAFRTQLMDLAEAEND